MKPLLKRRTRKATSNAIKILTKDEYCNAGDKDFEQRMVQAVKKRLDEKYISTQQENIIVTEMGFVTMALLSSHAIYKKDLLLVPGVDDVNRFGYLVLREGSVPYHSLMHSCEEAAYDAELAYAKAETLLAYYGNKLALKRAAQSAPWYLLSKESDVWDAGMCRWGAYSFSKRAGIKIFAHHVGVPRFLLRFAGAYGDRITASTLKNNALYTTVTTRPTLKKTQ